MMRSAATVAILVALAGCGERGAGTDTDAHAHADTDAHAVADTDAHAVADAHAHTDAHTDAHAVADAHAHARPASPLHFTDVTLTSGIDFVTTSGTTPSREILDVNGSGLALFDYDRDGDLDLFVANGATMEDPERGPGSRLYRNDGELRFVDVTKAAGIALTRWAMGVAVGDVDGDAYDDLYVTCFGANVLLRNRAGTGFDDVTARAGVGDTRWGTGAVFGDVDGDGDLDLYVANYVVFDPLAPPVRARHKGVEVMNGPHGLEAQHDVLYLNDGTGVFDDATVSAGCRPPAPGYGLGVVMLDFDRDGAQDIFVGNDSMANFLFHNDRAGRFREVGLAAGVAADMDGSNQATMGIGVADVDGNGLADLFTTNFANDTNTLHMSVDGLFFDDRTAKYGLALISRPSLGWGCGFFDFDHDGDEDLVAFNGHVYPEASVETMDSPYEQVPLLFVRDGRRFRRMTDDQPWLHEPHRDRATAFGDLDGDGDVDMVVGELNGPIRLLRNDHDAPDDWVVVTLADQRPGAGNPRGLGGRVELVTTEGRHTRWIHAGGSFQSASAPAAHFGVPAGVELVSIEVTWPDGTTRHVAPKRGAVPVTRE